LMHNPLDMLVFAKVVELHSFSLTAQKLGISRSAASKHVSRLERSLGARLLNRTTRKLSLTESGHAAYAHCARIAAEVEASELAVQCLVDRPAGMLRLSAPNAFGRIHLVPMLPEYLEKNPEVSIELVLSDRLVDLIDERFDIAISSSPLTQANLTKRELAPLEWVICASPAYLKRVKTPKNPDDLRQHNCIFYASDAVPGDVWTFSRKGETKLVRINGNFRANNSEAVRDVAARGFGIALLPTFVIWQDTESGALVRLLSDWIPNGTFGASLAAYFIGGRQITPKIRTLIDFLAQRFRQLPTRRQSSLPGKTSKTR
jgi:DNA-binding transcriptional LysR family regulator